MHGNVKNIRIIFHMNFFARSHFRSKCVVWLFFLLIHSLLVTFFLSQFYPFIVTVGQVFHRSETDNVFYGKKCNKYAHSDRTANTNDSNELRPRSFFLYCFNWVFLHLSTFSPIFSNIFSLFGILDWNFFDFYIHFKLRYFSISLALSLSPSFCMY